MEDATLRSAEGNLILGHPFVSVSLRFNAKFQLYRVPELRAEKLTQNHPGH